MGCYRHNAIVVTTVQLTLALVAIDKAKTFGLPVSEPVASPYNFYVSFLIAPDGCPEHMPASDDFDQSRDAFIEWLNNHRFEDSNSPYQWFELRYGEPCDEAEEDAAPQYHIVRSDIDESRDV